MRRAQAASPVVENGAVAETSSRDGDWAVCAATARLCRELEGRSGALADVMRLSAGYAAARSELGKKDHVTLLPNRLQFLADLDGAPAGATRTLVLVTLADAKHYNEILRALGHAFADDFVRAGMGRVRRLMPAASPLYHVSVLSFAFFIDDGQDDEALAAAMAVDFRLPVICQGLSISTAFGIGIVPLASGVRPASTLRYALAAAQDSRAGRAGWSRYDRASDEAHQRAFQMAHDLELALKASDQFSLQFQPRVALKTGHCRSAEALLRWRHPTLGPVSPAEFIPLAEATSTIGPLTDWVLSTGIRQAAAWRRAGIDIKLSINVSAHNLKEEDFPDRMSSALLDSGLEPSFLECEVTESVMAAADGVTNACLAAINRMGVDIAIDDFGSGYSGMSYLAKLPAQVLKIDRSFIRPLQEAERHRHLVRSIVNLAHDLDYLVVAEGIEDRTSYDMLAGWGCDEGQGYFMSRPIDAEPFARWVADARSLIR